MLNARKPPKTPASSKPDQVRAELRLEQLLARAGMTILFEGLWRRLIAPLCVLGLFLSVSWLGGWLALPRPWHIAGLALFGIAFLWSLFPMAGLRWPARADALARLDRDAPGIHGAASVLVDTPSNLNASTETAALWDIHKKRAEAELLALQVAPPSPRVVERDVYALRAAILLMVITSGFLAGPERGSLVLSAFSGLWGTESQEILGRIDAWIDPPAYTGRAPIVLAMKQGPAQLVEVPVGSIIVTRSSDGARIGLAVTGGLEAQGKPDAKSEVKPALKEQGDQRLKITGDGTLAISQNGVRLTDVQIRAIPDLPPAIRLVEAPKPNARGSMTLTYETTDDYGVLNAEARFVRAPLVDGTPAGRTLAEPPKTPLSLPLGPGGLGQGQTIADFSQHPWAGVRVVMTLVARDEGGNESLSEPFVTTLGQRVFVKPIARALADLRRILVLDPDNKERIIAGLEGLSIAPESFGTPPSVYLGLHVALRRLAIAKDDQQLLDVADLLWEMALRIEDGDASAAEQDLRAAQQKLREALQNGASKEEISGLMQEMRAAMDKFLAEMGDKARREAEEDARSGRTGQDQQRTSRMISPKDLQSMLDKMQDLAQTGDMADAQAMLDQLQNILENLRTARRGQPNPAGQAMSRALNELDALTREQQTLRDDTFRQDKRSARNQQRQRQRPPNGGEADASDGQNDDGQDQMAEGDDGPQTEEQANQERENLKERQQALQERLDALKRRMKQAGAGNEQSLDEAGENMGEANSAIGKGGKGQGKAVDAQGKAIENLRRGAQNLAQKMQQQGQGEGEGPDGDPTADGSDGQPGNGNPRQAGRGNDPLGRNEGQYNPRLNDNSRYNSFGASAARRAQQVLEELQRRLSDPSRPHEETDYLERLMRRY